ncbi:Protein of unknown function DUF4389 (plasmid) [Gemmatirosa kalamazoonensis]|uniref:Transmembrane protein n=1 Tax=Gemmatirosa kalamazoonensis TaxID=861299 RepID=W0RQF6_9BACT|nr:DUF4389 domain-containing protein [Gemmatirosa kalamazoonensis]AHG92585.1 Protein of unknown function DUF4389 [Gemmatirosa kalamazoonensis]
MSSIAAAAGHAATHPVQVHVVPATTGRNRPTVAFRPLLAIPHLIMVGGPIAAAVSWTWRAGAERRYEMGAGGVLGAVAFAAAVIAWFAILFTGRYPEGLYGLAEYYLRWRTRAIAYVALLRDEYPPFGDGRYPALLDVRAPSGERDRVSVGFRLFLAIPHLVAIWALGIAWAIVTVVAWFAILFTGEHPAPLYRFAVGVLRWTVRVEAYLLLLHDEYPPFSLG